ncbi:MAG: hypothetical protein NWE89_15610 [Candidatus Bathyarchaeota archaeon]|nr:hypothetical protein [Candidatus Bathyarchaeota archaeon]
MDWIDLLEQLKKVLPYWTKLNLLLAAVSIVSAIILWISHSVYPVTEGLLGFTIISLINSLFLIYWTFWFILAVPPIVLGLYLSRIDDAYYSVAIQNVAAVVVLYIIKLMFGFDLLPYVG